MSIEPLVVVGLVGFGFLANAVTWAMVSETNRLLPDEERFEYLGWGMWKWVRLWREHKRLFPLSRKRLFLALSSVLLYGGLITWIFLM